MAISCYQISCLTNKGDLGRRRKQLGRIPPSHTHLSAGQVSQRVVVYGGRRGGLPGHRNQEVLTAGASDEGYTATL